MFWTDGAFTLKQTKYKVSDDLKMGEADALFDYIAGSVEAFLRKERPEVFTNPPKERVFLGFTFSFPVRQSALGAGTLISWTKGKPVESRFRLRADTLPFPHTSGFDAKHSIGTDVVQMLQLALNRRQVPVACEALVNDTVGTMLSVRTLAWPSPENFS